jgi:hypothetical protein
MTFYRRLWRQHGTQRTPVFAERRASVPANAFALTWITVYSKGESL